MTSFKYKISVEAIRRANDRLISGEKAMSSGFAMSKDKINKAFSQALRKHKSRMQFGSIEYYALLELRDRLNKSEYAGLGLQNLDRLRFEVDAKIESIHKDKK